MLNEYQLKLVRDLKKGIKRKPPRMVPIGKKDGKVVWVLESQITSLDIKSLRKEGVEPLRPRFRKRHHNGKFYYTRRPAMSPQEHLWLKERGLSNALDISREQLPVDSWSWSVLGIILLVLLIIFIVFLMKGTV
jgi:hypothetical protein